MITVSVIVGAVIGLGIIWCFVALFDRINRWIKDDDDDD